MADAIVYPDPLPAWVRENHRRKAECRVYDALCRQLSAPWHVFYSRPWLGLDRNGLDREGEADFVLAHPELGMLVLEVKGGTISRDPRTGRWWSTSGDGLRHNIRDPVAQANRNKHALSDVLASDPRWGRRRINTAHAALFPDCDVPREDLGADMPRILFGGQENMEHLEAWMLRRLRHDSRTGPIHDALGQDGLEILTHHFARAFTLERSVAASLQSDDEDIRVLTDEQVRALDIFDDARRIGIPGPAGTGKTALALAQARRMAREGARTLLLCYNRPLARHLEREVGQVANLTVSTFHALCADVARRASIPLARPAGSSSDPRLYREDYPAALRRGLQRMPEQRFDAIVIDEGQDFPADWFPALEDLLRDPGLGRLFVFHDDNQRVRRTSETIAAHVPPSGVRLKRILRNGRRLVEELDPVLPRPYTPAGPDGLPIEWREVRGEVSQTELAALLDQLIHQRRIRPHQIAVLVTDEGERERLVRSGRVGEWNVVDAEAPPGSGVYVETIRRFKGLERPVVVVVEPEREIGSPEALYVALTRARVLLILLARDGRLAQMRMLLAPSRATDAVASSRPAAR